MKLNEIFNISKFSTHKRRLDRAGQYMGYFTMLATTAILVKLFKVDSWWVYVLGGLLVLSVRYFLGYMDEKKKVLANEQKQYSELNPFYVLLLEELKQINIKLEKLESNGKIT